MFGQKGQESTPFELLIAVIVMGFVIFVALQAMERLRIETCYNQIDHKLEEMRQAIETVVRQKSPQTVNFNLPICFDVRDERIRIRDWDQPQQCVAYCKATMRECLLLEYSGPKFSIKKCLNVSPDTTFLVTPGAQCKDRSSESFFLADLKSEMTRGKYEFRNKTLSTDIAPKICAYVKS